MLYLILFIAHPLQFSYNIFLFYMYKRQTVLYNLNVKKEKRLCNMTEQKYCSISTKGSGL